MEVRERRIAVVTGEYVTGKTYRRLLQIKKSVKEMERVLVLDAANEQAYRELREIGIEDIAGFAYQSHCEAVRLTPENHTDIPEMLDAIIRDYRGGLLILDNATLYAEQMRGHRLYELCATNRHKDMDVVIVYHSVNDIPHILWQNMSVLEFHRQNRPIEKHATKMGSKYEMMKIAELITNEKGMENRYFATIINMRENKIVGAFSITEYTAFVHQYIRSIPEMRGLFMFFVRRRLRKWFMKYFEGYN